VQVQREQVQREQQVREQQVVLLQPAQVKTQEPAQVKTQVELVKWERLVTVVPAQTPTLAASVQVRPDALARAATSAWIKGSKDRLEQTGTFNR
jgi:hypothetical protein